jgi:hypothetical protein
VVEHLASKLEALSSHSSTAKKLFSFYSYFLINIIFSHICEVQCDVLLDNDQLRKISISITLDFYDFFVAYTFNISSVLRLQSPFCAREHQSPVLYVRDQPLPLPSTMIHTLNRLDSPTASHPLTWLYLLHLVLVCHHNTFLLKFILFLFISTIVVHLWGGTV